MYIKDDSDNEQLNSSGSEDEEDLVLSSEDEKEKSDRLARAALKSYSESFTESEQPQAMTYIRIDVGGFGILAIFLEKLKISHSNLYFKSSTIRTAFLPTSTEFDQYHLAQFFFPF